MSSNVFVCDIINSGFCNIQTSMLILAIVMEIPDFRYSIKILSIHDLVFGTVTIYHRVMKQEYLLLLAVAERSVYSTLESVNLTEYLLEKITYVSNGIC